MPTILPILNATHNSNGMNQYRIISTCHEPAYAENGKPQLRYQLYHEEKVKGGVAMSMFGGSANTAPNWPRIMIKP